MQDQRQPSLAVNRDELCARLKDVAPPLADLYQGALEVLAAPSMPGRAHFLAHAAREIANGLPEWIMGITSTKEPKRLSGLAARWQTAFPHDPSRREARSPTADVLVRRDLFDAVSELLAGHRDRSSSRDAVLRLFTWLGPGNRYLQADLTALAKEWMAIRRWFESTTHARRSLKAPAPDEQESRQYFERFEHWLASLLQGFFAVRRELDVLLDDAKPEQLPELLPLLIGDQQRRHFFDRLAEKANPAWLGPLDQAGFFAHPPPVVREGDDSQTLVHTSWPAAPYLVAMARKPDAQGAVAAIAERLLAEHDIENAFVQKALLDVTLALPASAAARLSRKMRSWGGGFSDAAPRNLGALAVRLAGEGHRKDALALASALLRTRRRKASGPGGFVADPEPRIGRWALSVIVEKVLPDLITATRLDGFAIVCQSLAKALDAARDDSASAGEDHSHIWRRIIEDQNVEPDSAPSLLAAAACRSALQLAKSGVPIVDLVQSLGAQRWGVFRRIAQHLLALSPDAAPDALREHLLRRTTFDSFGREYRMLLAAGFAHLEPADQGTILGWLEAGPDPGLVRQSLAFWNGREPTAEEVERRRRWWRWRWLGPLTSHLSPEWKARQDELNREFGSPQLPDEPDFRTSFGQIRRPSPLTAEEGRTLSVREVAERLASWQPPPDCGIPSPADAEVLADTVAEDPDRFAAEATCFRGLKPTFVRALFNGLERAARHGKRFAWEPLLELASWVLSQEPVERRDLDPFREETEWEWSRSAWARLLQAGLARADLAPPTALREQVWLLIEGLSDDPPQTRADAIGAALQYAFWLRHGDGELFDNAPEVGRFLGLQLKRDGAGVPQVHAEFGKWLSWLGEYAPAWTSTNLHLVLPLADDLWNAAWRAHVRGPVPPRRAFETLQGAYRRAVGQISPGEPEVLPGVKTESRLIQERLADHVVVLYGRGDLEATGAAAILDDFFERATSPLRRHALWAIGHSLHPDEDRHDTRREVPPETLKRFRQLWERRRQRLQGDASVREELPAFGSWFCCGCFGDSWALGELEWVLKGLRTGQHVLDEPRVVRRLSIVAKTEPVRAARVLKRLVELVDEGSWVYGWIESAREIVGVAVRSGNPDAQKAVVDLLDRLGALGFRDFQDLVPVSHNLDDPLTIPYFLWDHPLTVAQLRGRLSSASQPERDRLLGLLLREASDVDVWKFTSPEEVLARWDGIEKHLGRRRAFWSLLLKKWQEQGLLAG